ncbi:MAG TPA: carboxypeptidase-like regulatory domain-containing protein [Jiangellales bacterium]|nr:carboxypeptidase-like regulatory domain-containing protein [Jiangellales bacterium]
MPDVVSGVVRDRGGRPLAGVRVFFTSSPVPVPDVATVTGADGAFQLTAPAPGEYEVRCVLPDGRGRAVAVRVTAGSGSVVAVDLPVGG